jgi:lysophospholipase L1-like esterase
MGIDDLHAAASAADLQAILTADGVHFTEEGYRLLAERVAATIRPML